MVIGKREQPTHLDLVVGIGASAGGLEAFTTFFAHVPPDSGMAFVLVQHLSPDHESALTEILARTSPIPVLTAQHDMRVEPNKAYVIPPDATLTIRDGRLGVVTPAPEREHRRPIDAFFVSLAADQGDNAVSIVLSGVGSDGSIGLAAVKEGGGLTIAQAEFDHQALPGMPQNAAATGLVDYVMQVEEMPAKLIEYRDHLALVADRKDSEGTRTDTAKHLANVLSVLRTKTGHDFTKYKIKTVTRRIQRRMQVLQADSVAAYIKHLREDPVEPELLFRDMLIGVTEFFRDPKAFEGLSAAIGQILDRSPGAHPFRVWAPACSTGEEVYSLAITIQELIESRDARLDVQIFGTDIDDHAVEFARAGRYQRTSGISAERLKRWFFEENGEFFPIRQIREMCVFSVHNVTKDPPFSRLDLISCRNLMIYLDSELQDRVLRTFHYALKPGGLLFLGLSENVSRHTKLFMRQNKGAHIFLRQDGDAQFPAMPMPAQTAAQNRRAGDRGRGSDDRVDHAVREALAKHSLVFVVVDRQSNIVRYSGGEVARYLEPSAGVASLSLLSNLRKSLRIAVRTALQSVIKTEQGTVVDNVPVFVEGQQRLLSVIVEPVQDTDSGKGLYVVAFKESRSVMPDASETLGGKPHNPQALAAQQELHLTRVQLQATINDLETANEELKSSAEEYQSVNEELQSTNEELQTSKEEMQSINEELQTINAEMIAKNDLLSNLNSDLQNLLDSTQIATIFLDDDLRIKNFTPGMANIFSLRENDRGRPLTEIVSLLDYDDLQRDVAKVLSELTVMERELELHDRGSSFVMRIRPYRSVQRVIGGVVITFVDVTERKRAERARSESERRFTAIVSQAAVGVAETNAAGCFLMTNAAFQTMSGWSAQELQRLSRQELIAPEDAAAINERFDQASRDRKPFEAEYRLVRADGSTAWMHDSVSVLDDSDGGAHSFISVTMQIDERKHAEQQTELLLGELDHRVKNVLAIVSSIIAQTLKANLSPEAFTQTIEGRIAAITRAHNLLTHQGAASVGTLRNLIDTELEPYQGQNLRIDGPAIVLTPKAGLSLAMAIHELASNAAKYGSLSVPDGQLAVSWDVTEGLDRQLRLIWAEAGGPPIPGPPTRRGFGTTLIERALRFEFDAEVDRSFAPSGVVCTILLPFTPELGVFSPPAKGKT